MSRGGALLRTIRDHDLTWITAVIGLSVGGTVLAALAGIEWLQAVGHWPQPTGLFPAESGPAR